MNSNHAIAAVAVLLTFGLATGPVEARQWRATSTSKAADYAQIIDQRSPTEIVIVTWVTPQMIEDTAENAAGRAALGDIVLIGAVHANISAQGLFTYVSHDVAVISVRGGSEWAPLQGDAISPLTAGILTAMQKIMENALGPTGQGMRWFAFDGRDIQSCSEGAFEVAYAGENYSYETPIPGCPGH